MTWDPAREADVVRSYRLQHELSRGSAADRAAADRDHWWAWEAVHDAVSDGDLPLEVIDAMLRDPEADDDHRSYVASGPIEDLLSDYADEYEDAIAERCRTDRVWAAAMAHVWLEREDWQALPDALRRLIPSPTSGRKGGGRESGAPATRNQQQGQAPGRQRGRPSRRR